MLKDEAMVIIKQKIAAAAFLIKEAEELAGTNNQTLMNLYDGNQGEVMDPIWVQLDEIGWSTSSLSC